MAQHRDDTVALSHLMWVDDVLGELRYVAPPRFDGRRLSFERRLVEDIEMVVFSHQLAQPLDLDPVDGIDEADNGSDVGQRLLAHEAHRAVSGAALQA